MSELAIEREIDRSKMQVSDEVAIEITNMNKWYGSFHVLRDINLTVNEGERIVIAGPSGSGKSTQIPKFCLELGRGVGAMIGHTQPRRLAARLIAAEEPS